MGKASKKGSASTSNAPVPEGGIDISKLAPEALLSLQKQLKAQKKETSGKTSERFVIIDGMLKDKDEAGLFRWTTRDILGKLEENNLVDKTVPEYDKVEIKKIQARKQFLEKRRNEKGELIDAEGTYGYKASDRAPFALTAVKVAEWFATPENVATLTSEQREKIAVAIA